MFWGFSDAPPMPASPDLWKSQSKIIIKQLAPDDLAPDDLAALPQLTDEAVMNGVKTRFEQNKIYTNINSLLIGARMPPLVVDAFRFQHGSLKYCDSDLVRPRSHESIPAPANL